MAVTKKSCVMCIECKDEVLLIASEKEAAVAADGVGEASARRIKKCTRMVRHARIRYHPSMKTENPQKID